METSGIEGKTESNVSKETCLSQKPDSILLTEIEIPNKQRQIDSVCQLPFCQDITSETWSL